MKKLFSVLVGAAALAAIAPVLTLALLHTAGSTARADAPPVSFWKVSMPDLGQHSDAWCWVGAAADSFWWFADNASGQQGLLGPDETWKNIDDDSKNAGSACWYDSRDAVDGLPAPVIGYPMVLRKIAESTFTDTNQNGSKDGLETNYCYGQGVEEWDYLIGLKTYVNNGNGLAVHDIIDPAKCAPGHFGLKVNRAAPTQNTLNPCGPGAVAPGHVPGVDQVAGPPTFLDYQTQLSSGKDVLLWLERTTSPTPETAHVVAGVGYNTAGGAAGHGTITVADPWTHTTNASAPPPNPVPSGLHSDAALPPLWQSKPDHNNSAASNGTDPFNLCDVTSTAPLAIRCYDEDNGGWVPWSVVDLIYVSLPADTPTPTSTPTNTPTPTPTRTLTPTSTPRLVGGVAEAPDMNGGSLAGASGGSLTTTYAAIGGAIAGILLLGAAGWYARRRWLA